MIKLQTTVPENNSTRTLQGSAIIALTTTFLSVVIFPYSIPDKLVFGIILGFLAFILYLKFIAGVNSKLLIRRYSDTKRLILRSSIVLVLMGAALLLFFNQVEFSFNNGFYFLSFAIISLLTSFLPGFLLISFVVKEEFSTAEKYTYSVLFSILVTGFVGFVSVVIGSIVLYSSLVFLTVLSSFLVAFSYKYKNRYHNILDDEISVEINLINSVILATIAGFLLFVYAVLHSTFLSSPLPILSDEPFHVGFIRKFLDDNLSWQEQLLQMHTAPAYPYLFHIFMGVGISASGLPIVDYLVLMSIILIPLPTISFYSLSSTLLNDSDKSLIATCIFTVFSGFGWIGSVVIHGYSSEILDIYISSVVSCGIIFSTWLPIIVAPYLLDLACFFMLLNLSLKPNISSRKLTLFMIPLMLISTLAHLEKIVLLSIIFVGISILQNPSWNRTFRVKEYGLSLISSCGIVFLWDTVAPLKLYIASFLTIIIALTILGFVLVIMHVVFSRLDRAVFDWLISNPKRILALFLSSYFALTIYEILIALIPTNDCAVIPLYILPSKVGWLLFGVLAWFVTLYRGDFTVNRTLVVVASAVIFLELLLYHIPFAPYRTLGVFTEEFRYFRDITWPFAAIIASIGLISILQSEGVSKIRTRLGNSKSLVIGALLIGIVISSSSFSLLLKVEYQNNYSGTNDDDQGVIAFLENLDKPKGAAIFAEQNIAILVYAATGMITYSPQTQIYGRLLASDSDIEEVIFVIQYLNISFLVLRNHSISGGLRHIIPLSEKIFSDSSYIVYSVEQLTPPSSISETAFLIPELPPPQAIPLNKTELYPWQDRYSSLGAWDLAQLSSDDVSYNLEITDNDTLSFEIDGPQDTRNVAFLVNMFDTPVQIQNNTYFWLRFRTETTATLIIHLIFEDGTSTNVIQFDSPFLQSEEWCWLKMQVPKITGNVSGIRIGATNRLHEYDGEISIEIDYSALAYSSPYKNRFISMMANSGVDFTIRYSSQLERTREVNQIVILDAGMNRDMIERIISQLSPETNLMIIGDITKSTWIQDFGNLTTTGLRLSVNSIAFDGIEFNIPSIRIEEFQYEGGDVIAWYNGNSSIPMSVEVPVSSEINITYVNLFSLFDQVSNLNLDLVLYDLLGFEKKQNEERVFYLKNTGSITISGNIELDCMYVLSNLNPPTESIQEPEELTLSIIGQVQLEMIGYGIARLDFKSDTRVFLNNDEFNVSISELILFASITRIQGVGLIVFDVLTSGFPYPIILDEEKYEVEGVFNIEIFPLSAFNMFILPEQLPGFTEENG
jgi:hypothetical protein